MITIHSCLPEINLLYCSSIKPPFFLIIYIIQWPNGSSQRKTPLMIPWQGPFHVSLNAEESTIQVFWPVFEKLYKALFGRLVKFRET